MLSDKSYFGFENLEVYQSGSDLAKMVYRTVESFPSKEQFGLISQICKAVNSICLNIAEGKGRGSDKNFLRFLYIARGSLLETVSATHLATNLELISAERANPIYQQASVLNGKLNAFIKTLEASTP